MEYRLKAHNRQSEHLNTMRNTGKLPGVVYNKQENRKVYVDMREFDKVFRQASIHHVITLEMDGGETIDTLVRQINLDKRKRRPEHVDFYALSDEPVLMYVPLKFVGTAAGVRLGGVLDTLMRDVHVKVSPKNIPDFIEVDVSGLGIGNSLHLSDIKLPEGVVLAAEPKATVVTVVPPEDAEKLAAPTEAPAILEPEVIKKGKLEEDKEKA
ncbi:MAG: 50S ribosomal protein L25 [Deinococcus sp.]|nr:50S ribosomal protein L25 [Deinococcus sp.]